MCWTTRRRHNRICIAAVGKEGQTGKAPDHRGGLTTRRKKNAEFFVSRKEETTKAMSLSKEKSVFPVFP